MAKYNERFMDQTAMDLIRRFPNDRLTAIEIGVDAIAKVGIRTADNEIPVIVQGTYGEIDRFAKIFSLIKASRR